MRVILNAYWIAVYWGALLFSAPLALYVYVLSALLWSGGPRRSSVTRPQGRRRPNGAWFL